MHYLSITVKHSFFIAINWTNVSQVRTKEGLLSTQNIFGHSLGLCWLHKANRKCCSEKWIHLRSLLSPEARVALGYCFKQQLCIIIGISFVFSNLLSASINSACSTLHHLINSVTHAMLNLSIMACHTSVTHYVQDCHISGFS